MIICFYSNDTNENKVGLIADINPVLNTTVFRVCVKEGDNYNEFNYEPEEFATALEHYQDAVKDFKKYDGKE